MSRFFTMKTENGIALNAERVAETNLESMSGCPDIGTSQKRVANIYRTVSARFMPTDLRYVAQIGNLK